MPQIIPAIDIIGGKCVRLSQGDYSSKKVYYNHPLEAAKRFEDTGITRLHLVDLDGAKAGSIVNYKVLETIAVKTSLVIDFGGGLKSNDDLRIAFECGAAMVTGGSIAVKDKPVFTNWIKQYGPDKIILGADVREEKIAVSGWEETTDIELFPFLEEYTGKGIQKVICTDVSKDGMLEGTSIALYNKILARWEDLYLIASGGVSSMDDIRELEKNNIPAVIIGKAIYEGQIGLEELKRYVEGRDDSFK